MTVLFGGSPQPNMASLRLSSPSRERSKSPGKGKRRADQSPSPSLSPYSPTRGLPEPPRDRSTSRDAWNLIRRGLSRIVPGPGAMERVLEGVNLQRQADNLKNAKNPGYIPKGAITFKDIATVSSEDAKSLASKLGGQPSESELDLKKTSGYQSRSRSAAKRGRTRTEGEDFRGRTRTAKPVNSSLASQSETPAMPNTAQNISESSMQPSRASDRSASRSPDPTSFGLAGVKLFSTPLTATVRVNFSRNERILFNYLKKNDGANSKQVKEYLQSRNIKSNSADLANWASGKMSSVLPGAKISHEREWGSGKQTLYRNIIPGGVVK